MYCRGLGLPFPQVEPSPQDQRQSKECYLFSDPACPDAPVLLHFPLVNASFKDHSAPGETAPPFITAWKPGPSEALPWVPPQCPCGQQRGKRVLRLVLHPHQFWTWQCSGVCFGCLCPCKVTVLLSSLS